MASERKEGAACMWTGSEVVFKKKKKKWSEKEKCNRVIKGKKDHFPGW